MNKKQKKATLKKAQTLDISICATNEWVEVWIGCFYAQFEYTNHYCAENRETPGWDCAGCYGDSTTLAIAKMYCNLINGMMMRRLADAPAENAIRNGLNKLATLAQPLR